MTADESRSDPSDEPRDADTQSFRAFVERGEQEMAAPSGGAGFRIATLLVGLVVFAGLVWLLLQG